MSYKEFNKVKILAKVAYGYIRQVETNSSLKNKFRDALKKERPTLPLESQQEWTKAWARLCEDVFNMNCLDYMPYSLDSHDGRQSIEDGLKSCKATIVVADAYARAAKGIQSQVLDGYTQGVVVALGKQEKTRFEKNNGPFAQLVLAQAD